MRAEEKARANKDEKEKEKEKESGGTGTGGDEGDDKGESKDAAPKKAEFKEEYVKEEPPSTKVCMCECERLRVCVYVTRCDQLSFTTGETFMHAFDEIADKRIASLMCSLLTDA